MAAIDLRDRDVGFDLRVFRIESRGGFELPERDLRFAVGHIGSAEQGQCRGIRRQFIEWKFEVFDCPTCTVLLQRGDRDKPYRPPIIGNIVQISVQGFFGLRELPERELCHSLEIVARRKQREFRTDMAKCFVCCGILLPLDEFRGAEVIGHKIIGGGPQDRVENLVRGCEIAASYRYVGASQKSQQILRIDLQCPVEQVHGAVQIAPGPQHFPVDL